MKESEHCYPFQQILEKDWKGEKYGWKGSVINQRSPGMYNRGHIEDIAASQHMSVTGKYEMSTLLYRGTERFWKHHCGQKILLNFALRASEANSCLKSNKND